MSFQSVIVTPAEAGAQSACLPQARLDSRLRGNDEGRPPATHFSPAKQAQFLETLALWGNARAACRSAQVAPQTAYRHRRNAPDFALAWDAAMVAARPQVEDVLGDRALNGIEEVIYYHGEEIGRRRRYDSRLLLAHLARVDGAACDERILAVAEDFDGALDRLRRGAPVHPDDAADRAIADRARAAQPWMDESLPFAQRVMLYLETIEDDADDADGADAEDEFDDDDDEDDDAIDPYADDGDPDREWFVPGESILLKDRVTPVTLPEPEPEPGPEPDPAPDAAPPDAEAGAEPPAVGAGSPDRAPSDAAPAAGAGTNPSPAAPAEPAAPPRPT